MSSRPAAEPLPRGFWVIWTAVAVDLVGFGIVLPILPTYAKEFGASPFEATLLVSAFSVAQLVFAPIWGRLSDRVGRRPTLTLALVGTAVGSLITGLAGSLWLLFLGRIVDGASGTSYVMGQAAVSDLTSSAGRPRALGLLASAFGLGFVAGPLIGSLTSVDALAPETPFFVAAALAGVNAVLAWVRVPETLTTPAPAPARHGRRLAAVGRLNLGALLLAALVTATGFSGFEATLGLLLEERFELDRSSVYGFFAIVGLLLVLVQVRLVGPVSARSPGLRGLAAALGVVAAGLGLLAPDGGWVLFSIALVLLVVGQGLAGPLLSAATVERAGPAARGEALGLQQSAGACGRVIGPAGAGLLFGGAAWAPYALGAVLVALAVVLVLRQALPARPEVVLEGSPRPG